ncbi:S1C family serine protease [Clostridium mediterraneense]|uniref:S1C family serine protease n=1 Tax=Clostridium mediterraneense TaxID=1805472 RepID=UPI000833F2CB|nr:trypsin-like peptidase domain-containing protein [Clostridium mediterraneense]
MGEFNNRDDKRNENNVYFGIENDDYKVEDVQDDDYNQYEEPNNQKDYDVKKKISRKGALGTVAIALTCSLIGGGLGGFGVYSAMKDNTKEETTVSKDVEEAPKFKNDGTMTTAEVVKMVSPAVVGVSTKSLVKDTYFNAIREQDGIGSGFIISEEGRVVTNYHVINGAQEVKVILSDGKEVNAKVVNYDANADIAVLQITDNIKMPGVAKLGDSSKAVAGEDVIAIGNPLGKEFSETITKGIISSPNRKLSISGSKDNVEEFIQTDAAINPGNSGGPLINANGEVIGINTAKKVGEEIEGIGFSIPINVVKEKLDSLSKPILNIGITARDVNEETAKRNNLEEGIYIQGISEFSPAEKAGLKIGDLITEYNGTRVKTVAELNELKSKAKENDVVNLTVLRDGKKINVSLKLTAS